MHTPRARFKNVYFFLLGQKFLVRLRPRLTQAQVSYGLGLVVFVLFLLSGFLALFLLYLFMLLIASCFGFLLFVRFLCCCLGFFSWFLLLVSRRGFLPWVLALGSCPGFLPCFFLFVFVMGSCLFVCALACCLDFSSLANEPNSFLRPRPGCSLLRAAF